MKEGRRQTSSLSPSPDGPVRFSEPQDQEIRDFYVAQKRHATDLEAPKWLKYRSGPWLIYMHAYASAFFFRRIENRLLCIRTYQPATSQVAR